MSRHVLHALAAVALLLALLPVAGFAQADQRDVIADQYIVVLQPGSNAQAEARGAASAHGVQVLHIYEHALQGFAFRGSAQAAQALARNPNVKFVSQDRVVWASAQTLPTGVDRIDGELNGTAQAGVDVNVAIVDTGIDTSHPDLNVVGGRNCSTGASYNDGNGHGTHVAGTVGALNNDTGVLGVAPGARLWAVRVLNNAGSGSWSSVICGIDWVTSTRTDGDASNDIAVANMSLGGSGSDDGNCGNTNGDALHQAICGSVNKGVVYVVAAGNDNKDAKGFAPAAYDEVLTVSAVADYNGRPGSGASPTCANYGADDTLASFSNYGADVDIAAPGVCIRSTYKGGGYATLSGTSMATPHVAGVVALYVADHGAATNAAGVATIRQHVTDPTRGYSVAQGDPMGFSGDKDSYAEPMAYVGGSSGGGGDDTTPPAAPANLTATAGDGRVDLDWADSGESDLAGYNVYRSTTAGSGYARINSSLVGSSAYADTSVANDTTYYYVVTAVDTSGNESANSTEASATPSAPEGGANNMYVWAIDFSEKRYGRNGSNADLMTTVAVRRDSDGDGAAESTDAVVSSARVELTLTNGSQSWSFAGDTNSQGQVTFTLKFAPPATYTATVTGVTHATYTYAPDMIDGDATSATYDVASSTSGRGNRSQGASLASPE